MITVNDFLKVLTANDEIILEYFDYYGSELNDFNKDTFENVNEQGFYPDNEDYYGDNDEYLVNKYYTLDQLLYAEIKSINIYGDFIEIYTYLK